MPRNRTARRAPLWRLPVLAALAAALLVAACAGRDAEDPLRGKLETDHLPEVVRAEGEELKTTRDQERALEEPAPRPEPELEPLPPAYDPLDEVRVSLTMRDHPLHDVLLVVARNAGLDLLVEPGISLDNRVTISFENARSSTVVESLLRAYDLHWEVTDNLLYVGSYTERTFNLGFLNSATTLDMNNGGDIFGTVDAEGASSASGELTGEIRISSSMGRGMEENSLYALLSKGLTSLLTESGGQDVVPSLVEHGGTFTIDPVSGTLEVTTTPRKMRAVARYVHNLKQKLGRQVVIDARIMEVSLRDQYKLGIDWNYVLNQTIDGVNWSVNMGWTGTADEPGLVTPGSLDSTASHIFTGDADDADWAMSATVDILENFGGVKVVSNPHVRARHGQPTLFTSGRSHRFVSEITREEEEDDDVTFSVETDTIFDGVMLGVIPFINDDNTVDLKIFPIRSSVDEASLELVEVTADGTRISLPEIEIKNVSTSVRVRDNDLVILGGLIDKVHDKDDREIPTLGQVPLMGWLFKQRKRMEEVRELVILMAIRIV